MRGVDQDFVVEATTHSTIDQSYQRVCFSVKLLGGRDPIFTVVEILSCSHTDILGVPTFNKSVGFGWVIDILNNFLQ